MCLEMFLMSQIRNLNKLGVSSKTASGRFLLP